MIQKRTCPGGPIYFCHQALERAGVRHGFFTRKGGLSTGIYDSLNCGLGSDDDTKMVRANRGRVAVTMGLDLTQMAGLYQVHSPKCVTLTHPGPFTDRPQADAYVTALAGTGLPVPAGIYEFKFTSHGAGLTSTMALLLGSVWENGARAARATESRKKKAARWAGTRPAAPVSHVRWAL